MMRSLLSASTVLASLVMLAPAANAGWGCGHHRNTNSCCGTQVQPQTNTYSNTGCCGTNTGYSSGLHHGTSYYPSTTYQSGTSYTPSTTYNSGSCCGGSGYTSNYGQHSGGVLGHHSSGYSSGYTNGNGGYYQGSSGYSVPGYVDGPGYQAQRFSNRYRGVGSGW